jgi:hypothetical protein
MRRRYGWAVEPVLFALAVVVALGVAALIVHISLTWADRRGWVYYRNPDRRPPQSLGMLEEIYQPSVTHVIEQEILEDSIADAVESVGSDEAGTSR